MAEQQTERKRAIPAMKFPSCLITLRRKVWRTVPVTTMSMSWLPHASTRAACANRAGLLPGRIVERARRGRARLGDRTPYTTRSGGRGPQRRCRASSVVPAWISPAASLSLARRSLPVTFLGCRRPCRWRWGRRARQLRANAAQQPDTCRQLEPVIFDDRVEFSKERLGFFARQPELYAFDFRHGVMRLIGNRCSQGTVRSECGRQLRVGWHGAVQR